MRTGWTSATPGAASSACIMDAGKRKSRAVKFSEVETNTSGLSVSFIHSSMCSMLPRAIAALSDDQSQGQHERGDGGGGAARSLQQAVGGERAFDGAEPLEGLAEQPHKPLRKERHEQQRRDDRHRIARDRRAADTGRGRSRGRGSRCRPRRRGGGSDSRRRRGPGICPFAAPGPVRRARRCAQGGTPRSCWY